MKTLRSLITAVALVALTACAQLGMQPGLSTTQQAVDATTVSYKALDAAILAADSAVKTGVLKGSDARNALKGMTDAKAGLDLALITLRNANAAAAATAATAASGVKP
jgi:hypothetical protein